MKDLAGGKKYRTRKAGSRGQHTSIHKSFTENFDDLPTGRLIEKLTEVAGSNSFDNLIFRERDLLQTFLQARGLPFEQGVYDENGRKLDFSVVDALTPQEEITHLQGFIKKKHDSVPGATIAAEGINCISAIEQYRREQKLELALHYAMELVSHARDIHLIRHENLIHAGKNRNSVSAKTKSEETKVKIGKVHEWIKDKKKSNDQLSKTQLCQMYVEKNGGSKGTFCNWFDKDLNIKPKYRE